MSKKKAVLLMRLSLSLALFAVAASAFVSLVFFADRVQRPRETPPAHVQVDGRDWTITEVEKIEATEPHVIGFTDCESQQIFVVRTPDERNTVIHELSHAAVCLYGEPHNMAYGGGILNPFGSSSSELHEGIYLFAKVWSKLLGDNPEVGRYLSHE